MNIYFLRHAESTFNADPSDDSIDCPLTWNGVHQSTQLDCSSFPKHYSLIICSPLRRCVDTLKHSPLTYDQLEINDLFREIRSGCQSDLLNSNESLLIEDEKNIRERIKRINDYLSEKKQINICNLLIVTHADLVWNLTSHEVNGELFGIWLNNGELYHWKEIK